MKLLYFTQALPSRQSFAALFTSLLPLEASNAPTYQRSEQYMAEVINDLTIFGPFFRDGVLQCYFLIDKGPICTKFRQNIGQSSTKFVLDLRYVVPFPNAERAQRGL